MERINLIPMRTQENAQRERGFIGRRLWLAVLILTTLLLNRAGIPAALGAILTQRPETVPVGLAPTDAGDWVTPFPGSLAGTWLLFYRGNNVTLTGTGYFVVRWEVEWWRGLGLIAMPTFTVQNGSCTHIASGGGYRMDDLSFNGLPGQTSMGRPNYGFSFLPDGTQMIWKNEYYYLNGTVNILCNENANSSGALYNLGIAPSTWAGVNSDINAAPNNSRRRFGVSYDPSNGATLPPPPNSLSATALASPQVALTWNNPAANADGTMVEYSTDNQWFQMQNSASIAPGITSYLFYGLLPGTTYSFRVRNYNAAGNSSYSDPVSVATLSSPPPPWVDTDIGSVGVRGNASYSNGTFAINASGADFWGSSDSGHFVYQSLSGDSTIIARVVSQTNTSPAEKAGVMFRQSLDPSSPFVDMFVTPSSGVNLKSRNASGILANHEIPGISAPYWVKLVRRSSTFTGFASPDGLRWSQCGIPVTIAMPDPLDVGLAVTAHNNSTIGPAVLDNVSIVSPNTAPTVAVPVSANPSPVAGTATSVSVLGADDGGKSSLIYSWSASGPAAVTFSASGNNAAKNATATFTQPGIYTLIATITDTGGLLATSSVILSVSFGVPTTTAGLGGTQGTNGWYISPVQVTLAATNSVGPGVAATYYTVDGGSQQTYASPFTVTGDGTHTVTYWSVDTSGNTETAHSLTVKIDATPPVVTFGALSPTPNAAGWNNSSVSLPYTTTDATSGLLSATPGSPLTFTTEGANQTQTVTATDSASNSAQAASPAVSIDLTAPTTTASASGAQGNGGVYTGTATVTLTATDALSGVASTLYAIDGGGQQTYSSPFLVTNSGSHTVNYFSTDIAGNAESAHTLTLQEDTTPPMTTVTLSGTAGANGWYTSAVQVTLAATDTDGAGDVAATTYTVDGSSPQTYSAPFTVIGVGAHTVAFFSTDKAGNAEAAQTQTISIDSAAPAVAFGTASPAPNSSGWNNSAVSIPYTASDATSGVATASPGSPLTFTTEATNQTQTMTATDKAGNSAQFTSPAISIDETAPATTAATANQGGSVTFTLNATDALSGVAITNFTVDNGAQQTYTSACTLTGAGSHTVSYFSTDKAGNSESARTLSITINAAPTLASLSPSSATAGKAGFTLTVSGTGFTASSVVKWQGSALATTFVAATQLTAAVPASLIASTGTASVTVTTPAPGGGTSTAKTFTIKAATLSALSLAPTSVVGGVASTGTVTLTGPAPAGGLTVNLSSSASAAAVPASVTVMAGQSSATFPSSTSPVTASVSVSESASYGGVKKTATLTVKPPDVPRLLNCGGAAVSPFVADGSYTGGSGAKTSHAIDLSGASNAAPAAVYQSQRGGTFTYALSGLSPGAGYTLRLHFAEFQYFAAGRRVFNVSVNGSPLLSGFDIYAAAGNKAYKAVAVQASVTASSSGQVVVAFTPGAAGAPAVNGIELR